MLFENFIEESKAALEEFGRYWIESNEKNPRHFPMQMDSGDWDEQFTLWNEDYEP